MAGSDQGCARLYGEIAPFSIARAHPRSDRTLGSLPLIDAAGLMRQIKNGIVPWAREPLPRSAVLLARTRDKHLRRTGLFMTMRWVSICAMILVGATAFRGVPPAQALTMKECSAKYQAAQQAGTLQGMKWNDFRKAECSPNASATSTPSAPATSSKPTAAARATRAATGNAVFPTAVSPKYSSESAGKARMHTCLDQYNANKGSNANGGLNWIQKGGGYYSECNKRLKG